MKKNGFTLLELLAVIVILAILAVITIPIVNGIITNAKESADRRSIDGYYSSAKNYFSAASLNEEKKATLDGTTNVFDALDTSNASATGKVTIDVDGNIALAIVLNGKCYTKRADQQMTDLAVSTNIDTCNY